MTISKRHHYIPQFFIKGFTGDDKKVSVYDLESETLKPKRKSPKQIFYEWNRNTFNVQGEKTDFVEDLYQFYENRFAPIYKRIIKQRGPIELDEMDMFHIILFIGSLYWRLPSNDEKSAEIISNSTNQDLLFKIKTNDGSEASDEIYQRIMNEPAFMGGSKIMLSIRDYLKADIVSNFENWKLYYPATDVQLHLLGDNPVLRRSTHHNSPFDSELIFRLSKGISVYYTKGKRVKELPPEHAVNVDVLIYLQSEKMICGPNEMYLYHISELAKQCDKPSKVEYLKEEVFSVFDNNLIS